MVLSKLNESISYPETRTIHNEDISKERELYEIEINDIPIIIAIGNIQKKYKENNIIYYPIYFIKKNKKAIQIGVYEVYSDELNNYLDDEKMLDIERLEPLIYPFVLKHNFLETNKIRNDQLDVLNEGQEDNEDKEEIQKEEEQRTLLDEKTIPEIRRDIFTINPEVNLPKELKEENEEESKNIVEKYHESNADIWIQKFMKNKNYLIQDNEGGGDCFFATIRDAFQSIGQETTVNKLREKLSKEVKEQVFVNYKQQYDLFNESIKKDKENLLQIKKEIDELKLKLNNIIYNGEKKEITNRAKQLKEQYNKISKEMAISKEYLNEYKFLKGIKNLQQFKEIIKTCKFWADLWAIVTIERLLNIKFIILSSESYKNNDLMNIIKCGNNEDPQILELGVFEPEYYILLDHTGDHYKLIGYKNKKIFKYTELPYDLKNMIVNKCMEKNAGLFNIIPDFKKLKLNELQEMYDEEKEETLLNVMNIKEVSQSQIRNLFDEDTILLISTKLSDKVSLGKSNGEKIPPNKLRGFAELNDHKDWRKKLDDYWLSEFVLDNHKWASVVNYVQGSKYKQENNEFYLQFSLDSDSKISKDPELAKKVADSKTGVIKGEVFKPKKIQIDSDYQIRKNKEQYDAILAKFTQNQELATILLETNDAKLMYYIPKEPPEIADNIMLVREKLKQ